uniref:EF-hand domain-containing protein n=1 Tax=Plectus sambesii TaxID=2011161 RepID=A0A914UX74_9BILA
MLLQTASSGPTSSSFVRSLSLPQPIAATVCSTLSFCERLRYQRLNFIMAAWDHELREMFSAHDKDMSGFIGREDVLCMLLAADKDDQKDPAFRTNLRFLIQCIKEADKDGDAKISFDEFKQYIEKATAATK